MALTARKIYPAKFQERIFPSCHLRRSSKYLFNRELSLLEFFRRVLDEGLDENQPILERLKFLSILSSNLDEFFMIRVSGLKEKAAGALSPDGMTPDEELAEIRTRVLELTRLQTNCLRDEILSALARRGAVIEPVASLTQTERQKLFEYFTHKIYPVLTPQAVDPSHPFPYISGGSLNFGLMVNPEVSSRIARNFHRTGEPIFTRLKIPSSVERLIPIGEDSTRFVLAEDLIAEHLDLLIPSADPADAHLFRLTRDADLALREEETEDLRELMEENLKQRRFGETVRLEVDDSMPAEILDHLTEALEISPEDVYPVEGAMKITDFTALCKLPRIDLKDAPLCISYPAVFESGATTFDIIKRQDVLLHHPYHPYDIITNFLKEAVEDDDVLSIKICLYRTGADSPIPPLLIEAAERGKQVTILIELKARFDEKNNIEWAKQFEHAGIHVIYGLPGLKTHCKTTLIVRREADGELRHYVHLATGNYNPETSAVYTDLGLLTDDEKIGEDALELFNFLTAYSEKDNFRRLLVAPINLRGRMLKLIKRETANAQKGLPARIIAKMNRLADPEIIDALYKASEAGVEIDLIVRGICMLRPGIAGLSENIRVRSIVGRLLEHSRVYYFENAGAEEIYIGSADWMPRNLDRRVEVLAPVIEAQLKRFLKDEFLTAYLRDNTKAARLMADGSYQKIVPTIGEEPFNSQLSFQDNSNVVRFDFKCSRGYEQGG